MKASEPTASKLPRWRGFNLLEKYRHDSKPGPFKESDFDLVAGWGFDFVRLPMSYRCWATEHKPKEINEAVIAEIDRAVSMGQERGIHVNLNLHRAPGYCVNSPPEPRDLWTDPAALDDFVFHWAFFANRYRGVSNRDLSFDLLNEPPDIPTSTYVKVVTRLVEAIREMDPTRLIIADGLQWGRSPVPELVPLGIAQSMRGYEPMGVSHWRANWVKQSDTWPKPTWPLTDARGEVWDCVKLVDAYDAWEDLEAAGTGVHVGEFGAHCHTPHDVALAWMSDLLGLWKEKGWGWALWNLRGSFGVLDSGREDVRYETLGEHKLDRKMLELLKAN